MPDGIPTRKEADMDVIVRYAEVMLREEGKVFKKCHLQNRTYTNPDTHRKCLRWLLSRGYIQIWSEDGRHQFIMMTEKGHGAFRNLIDFVEGRLSS